MPALVQNEIHPYYQEQDVVPFIQEKGIVVQCWYPLGGSRLLDYHTASQSARIACILVSTKMSEQYQVAGGDIFCSGDQLNRAIQRVFAGESHGGAINANAWIDSEFIGLEKNLKTSQV